MKEPLLSETQAAYAAWVLRPRWLDEIGYWLYRYRIPFCDKIMRFITASYLRRNKLRILRWIVTLETHIKEVQDGQAASTQDAD